MPTSVLAPILRAASDDDWPAIPLSEWHDTLATVHRWTQVVGKICLQATPLTNHWWNAALHVTSRGLASPTCIAGDDRAFSMAFDFVTHRFTIQVSDGDSAALALEPRSVADFYEEVMRALRRLGIDMQIWTTPVEMRDPADAIPFERDEVHRAYDAERVNAFFRALVVIKAVFARFRSEFIGKCSPVHFFWGSFDLCCTRFSGRRAPPRAGASFMEREAYSHEVISHGFWPGSLGSAVDDAAFYAYCVPEPPGFERLIVSPSDARYDREMRELILPYEAVRTSRYPARTLREFLKSSYDHAAELAAWNRAELERFPPEQPASTALDDVAAAQRDREALGNVLDDVDLRPIPGGPSTNGEEARGDAGERARASQPHDK